MRSVGMLSRIAESLFWIGRYVERADDTARILDAFLARHPGGPLGRRGRGLPVAAGHPRLGPAARRPARPPATCWSCSGFDADNPSSIAGALSAARENARGARETISSEMWECLNVTWHSLPPAGSPPSTSGPALFLGFVRERAAVLAGLAESTMSRDDGWRFLVLGRSLERVDMTARLLSIQAITPDRRAGSPTSGAPCCGPAGPTSRSCAPTAARCVPQRVAEFLLLDRLFPRSALHALTEAEECLEALAPATERAGMADPARRPVGQARTRLEYADAATLLDELPPHLRALQRACAAASAAITARYFDQTTPVAWAHEGV